MLEFVGEVLAPTRHFGYFGSLALFNRTNLIEYESELTSLLLEGSIIIELVWNSHEVWE